MNSLVLVSVVIPTYNRAHLIERSVTSALNQTCKDLEVLVIDDGSNDETFDVVKHCFRQNRVRYIRHETNKGHQAARNTGIKNARGEYIAFLDSDDAWIPQKTELQLSAIRKLGVDCVALSGCLVVSNGSKKEYLKRYNGYVYKEMLASPGPSFCCMLVPKKCLQHIGLLDENIRSYADWDTCISLSKFYQFVTVEELCTINYASHTDSVTRNPGATAARGLAYERIVKKNQDEMCRVIGRKGLARHFWSVALLSDDRGDFNRCRRYLLKAFRLDSRSPSIFLFAFWALFGAHLFHRRKSVGAIQKRLKNTFLRLESTTPA